MIRKILSDILLFCSIISVGICAPAMSAGGLSASGQLYADATIPLSSRIEANDVESVILEKAHERLEQYVSSENYRFDIQSRWIPNQLLQLPADHILALELQGRIKRYTNFEVLYRQRGSRQRTEIQLRVETEQKLPVVTGRIKRGEKLTSEKLVYQWVSLSRNTGHYIEEIEMLEGKTLRRTLLSGQPVRESFISREVIIEAGDEVKVFIDRNGVQVQLTGEARENGAQGDRIRVYSSETRKKYEGEVIRPGVILWKNTL